MLTLCEMFVLSCLSSGAIIQNNALTKNLRPGPKVINFIMLNSTQYEIYHAHKYWHFNIYKHGQISMINTTSECLKARKYFSFYEQMRCHAQLS